MWSYIYVVCHLKITFNLPTANTECFKHKKLLISLQLSWFGRYKSLNVNGRDKAVHKSVCFLEASNTMHHTTHILFMIMISSRNPRLSQCCHIVRLAFREELLLKVKGVVIGLLLCELGNTA